MRSSPYLSLYFFYTQIAIILLIKRGGPRFPAGVPFLHGFAGVLPDSLNTTVPELENE